MSEKKAWDPDNYGYGKHDYQHIDPGTVNVEEFATSLRGEEQHFGDVRQYNSAYNEKHPENNTDLDWLGRVGTVFETDAEGFEGMWHITNMPVVRSPFIYCRAVQIKALEDDPEGRIEKEISCTALGCSVNEENLFEQVKTVILKKGSVDRKQRIKLTKKT